MEPTQAPMKTMEPIQAPVETMEPTQAPMEPTLALILLTQTLQIQMVLIKILMELFQIINQTLNPFLLLIL